jgi:crotonobetainyl-CoA:carnitine CoA-transferase CaiB-like acyl-CoA transferase
MLLTGVRVVDVAVYGQGPLVSAILSDLGADVIKIEDTNIGDPMRHLEKLWGVDQQVQVDGRSTEVGFEFYSHGKRGIALNYESPAGQEILERMVKGADVFTHNLRKKRVAKLNFGYERIRGLNPRIIYHDNLSFGSSGPWADAPAFDGNMVGYSGLMYAASGSASEPEGIVGAVGDYIGGAWGATAILAGLVARSLNGGNGLNVETSQLGSLIALLSLTYTNVALTGVEYKRERREEMSNPLFSWYRAKDANWLALTVTDPARYWPAICDAIDRPDLSADPRCLTPNLVYENRDWIRQLLDHAFGLKSREELLTRLRAGNVFCSPVFTPTEAFTDEQVRANGYISRVPEATFDLPVAPVKVNGAPLTVTRRAPTYGEHTDEVLTEFGYGANEIADLRAAGVVR